MPSAFGRLVLSATERNFVQRMFTGTGPGRAVARRFVAGDTLDEAVAVTARLNASGFPASLNHLGEHVEDGAAAERAFGHYMESLDHIEDAGLDANISVKLTQLGLEIDVAKTKTSLGLLAERAESAGTTVTIDMEESRHVDATLEMFSEAQERHGNLGVAIQAYLHRSPADLERILPLGGHVRLCKGAYLESPDVALQRRSEVGERFDSLLEMLMAVPETMTAIATHDDERISSARRLISSRTGPYEFQMLYGVREAMQRELSAAGSSVRVYLPYGAAWYPYLTRRLAERPANLWFFVRSTLARR